MYIFSGNCCTKLNRFKIIDVQLNSFYNYATTILSQKHVSISTDAHKKISKIALIILGLLVILGLINCTCFRRKFELIKNDDLNHAAKVEKIREKKVDELDEPASNSQGTNENQNEKIDSMNDTNKIENDEVEFTEDNPCVVKEASKEEINIIKPQIYRPLKLNNFMSVKHKTIDISEGYALEIMRFAETDQDILPILAKYNQQLKDCRGAPRQTARLITQAGIEVIEQSLGIEFRKNPADNHKIIFTFMRRLLLRSYHGTRTNMAKNILNVGISFNSKDNTSVHNEFVTLVEECNLDKIHWPFAFRDRKRFYVSHPASGAIFYAHCQAPEWFGRFQNWGSDQQGNLDLAKLRENIMKQNPKVKNVERVTQFIQNNWNHLAARKKNSAILIVEQNERDPALLHNQTEFEGDFLNVLWSYSNNPADRSNEYSIFGERVFLNEDMDVFFEYLFKACCARMFGSNNEKLDSENTVEEPSVIHAVKIPIARRNPHLEKHLE